MVLSVDYARTYFNYDARLDTCGRANIFGLNNASHSAGMYFKSVSGSIALKEIYMVMRNVDHGERASRGLDLCMPE